MCIFSQKIKRFSMLSITAVMLACLFNCSLEEKADKQQDRKYNIILIVIDTLRADHLGCYGYKYNISPQIDAFSRKATLYTRAIAASPWTLPTHASIFTGKYPFEHGVHTIKLKQPEGTKETDYRLNYSKLSQENLTLAEVFKSNGYKTAAFIANAGFLSERFQLNQGFDTYYLKHTTARRLNKEVFSWFKKNTDSPFFLFLNYMDTHTPYNTSSRSFFEKAYREALIKIDKPSILDQRGLLNKLFLQVMPAKKPVSADLVNSVIQQYDRSIENIDDEIGALLDRLVQMGLYDDTVIVLTSDHGEQFGEHHLVEHSKDVYNEALWVPLIIKGPFQKDGRIDERYIASPHLPQMIFSQLPRRVAGRYEKQFPYHPGNQPIISENYYTRPLVLNNPVWGKRFDRIRRAIYQGAHKFIFSSDGNHELYNLDEDPKETDNMILKKKGIAENLLDKITRFIREGRSPLPAKTTIQPPSQQEVERLKSLGYL